MRIRLAWPGVLAALVTASDAAGQYYPAPYPPPGTYLQRRRPRGAHCDARLPTTFEPQRLICSLVRPRLLDRPCPCPPPFGSRRGPDLRGRVIR